jgi:hypothetical protein
LIVVVGACIAPITAAVEPAGTNFIQNGDFAIDTGYTPNPTTLPVFNAGQVVAEGYRTWFRGTALTNAIGDDGDSYGQYLAAQQFACYGAPARIIRTSESAVHVNGFSWVLLQYMLLR